MVQSAFNDEKPLKNRFLSNLQKTIDVLLFEAERGKVFEEFAKNDIFPLTNRNEVYHDTNWYCNLPKEFIYATYTNTYRFIRFYIQYIV